MRNHRIGSRVRRTRQPQPAAPTVRAVDRRARGRRLWAVSTVLRRVEKLARHRAEEPPYQHTPAPWQRLIRYRGADEPLSDFRRRVVDAIRTAQETGGRVEDHL